MHLLNKEFNLFLKIHSKWTNKLSNNAAQRPPNLSENKNHLIVYSAKKEPHIFLQSLPAFINRDLKRSHAVVFPHFLCSLSGLGAPFLDYYYHPVISIGMLSFILLYPGLYMPSARITHLSMNSTKDYLFIKTGLCQQVLKLSLSACSFNPSKTILYVNERKFRFLAGGEFDSENITAMKRCMRERSDPALVVELPSKLNLFCSELASHNRYLYIFIFSTASILMCYMCFGYTDLMYPFIKVLTLIDDKVLDRWKDYMVNYD